MDFSNPQHLQQATKRLRDAYLQTARTVPISTQQAASLREEPVSGPVWVTKFTVAPSSHDNSRALLLQLIDQANDKGVTYNRPRDAPLACEWTGHRSEAGKDTPETAGLSDQEKFLRLDAETKQPLAILYLYGGSLVLNGPANYRRSAGTLAKATAAKVLMVRQRLAPQHPFPAALLDAFQAYLTLLAPPPGAPHAPVPPESIVLLRLQRQNATITFHGHNLSPELPAGMALLSPVADITNAFPSYERNACWDIFPVPVEKLPYLESDHPPCDAWPAHPPRAHVYCEAGMLAHPLVSPVAADWTGSCPLWLASGQEQLVDATRVLARTAHAQGVSVVLQEYEAMPHIFFQVHRDAPQTRKLMADWVKTILAFARKKKIPSVAATIRARDLVAEPMDFETLVPWTQAEVRGMMWQKTRDYKVPAHHRELRSAL
ncbi:alpha/beta-hydrolase [Aspergillus indologenus CBS 114.80]|uniref:Alpha/beta-hydrolase n=1 Tax=Aspergillus indologenus CBS 114.80 TaxID=1450541 RepID=A0A2V5JD17_9EURO|nr:alpha/beta-hydrolase [Aspergillus indologenus CBS 114.80]